MIKELFGLHASSFSSHGFQVHLRVRSPRKAPHHVEFTTAGALLTQTLPLIVALHGYGDNPQNFARMWKAFPGPARFIVFQAPRVKGPGFSWLRVKRP